MLFVYLQSTTGYFLLHYQIVPILFPVFPNASPSMSPFPSCSMLLASMHFCKVHQCCYVRNFEACGILLRETNSVLTVDTGSVPLHDVPSLRLYTKDIP
jgi:hypothetical protein